MIPEIKISISFAESGSGISTTVNSDSLQTGSSGFDDSGAPAPPGLDDIITSTTFSDDAIPPLPEASGEEAEQALASASSNGNGNGSHVPPTPE